MASAPLIENRVCRKCGIEKPHDAEHFVLKLGKLTPLCRECSRASSKAYFRKNRDQMLAGFREARKANPEFHRERQRRYYRENPEAHAATNKRYRDANREKYNEGHRRWSAANPDRIAFYNQRYQQSPEGKASQSRRNRRWRERHGDRIRADTRAWYRENREEILEYGRQWRHANRERLNALAREWNRKNKAKRKAFDHRRRIANGSGVTFTKDDVERIFAEQDGLCTYCEVELSESYEVDHFIPVAGGGGHEPENIVLACMPCNRSKGAKMPWDWRPDLFRRPPY